MKYLFSALCLSLFLIFATTANAVTIFVDCPSVQAAQVGGVPIAPGSGNASPCTLSAPGGSTVTDLMLTYKYSFTTGLNSGTGTFDHSTLDAALASFSNGPAIVLTEPPASTTGNLSIHHTPTGAELTALASNGGLNFQYSAISADVLTLSGDFRWTIEYTPQTVPEPSPLVLLGFGLIATALISRRVKASVPR